jgi:hypothetical protein
MNALETAIKAAIESTGEQNQANKAYLEFLKANFIIPIEKSLIDEEPVVLYLHEDTAVYLPVFTNMGYFDEWAHDIREQVQLLKLSGVDLLKGIGDNITICLNPGSALYKTFNPAEIARLKNMVLKLFK